MISTQSPHRRRQGFTLLELLVVIAIISLLAALIIGATMRVIGVQMTKNTDLLLQKLQPALVQQWQATIDQANQEPVPDAVVTAAGSPQAGRNLWIKLRLRQQFPVTFAQALDPSGTGLIAAEPAYKNVINGAGAVNANDQQAILLYLALKNNRRGSSFDPDRLSPRELQPVTLPTTNVSTMKLIDSWKNPLNYSGYLGTTALDATSDVSGDVWISSTGGPGGQVLKTSNQRIGGTGG
ncbi:MAG: type II secretion system GspH family protein [Gemmataceae bacterium]|nr:type II secretion system GspH family protein [Gemmataceae bacterium]